MMRNSCINENSSILCKQGLATVIYIQTQIPQSEQLLLKNISYSKKSMIKIFHGCCSPEKLYNSGKIFNSHFFVWVWHNYQIYRTTNGRVKKRVAFMVTACLFVHSGFGNWKLHVAFESHNEHDRQCCCHKDGIVARFYPISIIREEIYYIPKKPVGVAR